MVKHLDGKEESSEGWSAGFLNKIGSSTPTILFSVQPVVLQTDAPLDILHFF